jgi:hypothetical protein
MSGAAVIIRQNRLIRQFREAGATAPALARPLSEIGVRYSWVFRRMAGRGVFVRVTDDRYYMDEEAVTAFLARRTRVLLTFTIVVMVAFVIYLLVRGGH